MPVQPTRWTEAIRIYKWKNWPLLVAPRIKGVRAVTCDDGIFNVLQKKVKLPEHIEKWINTYLFAGFDGIIQTEPDNSFTYYVYDYCPYWENRTLPYEDRMDQLLMFLEQNPHLQKTIKPVIPVKCDDYQAVIAMLKSYVSQNISDQIIIRTPGHPYASNRKDYVWRFNAEDKEFYARIISVQQELVEVDPDLPPVISKQVKHVTVLDHEGNIHEVRFYTVDFKRRMWQIRNTLVGKYLVFQRAGQYKRFLKFVHKPQREIDISQYLQDQSPCSSES